MSNIIPPLLSNSPPPSPSPEEDEDDEFGDFTVANDLSYGCDSFSPLPSPDLSPDQGSPFRIPNESADKEKREKSDQENDVLSNCDCSNQNKTSNNDNKLLGDKISENDVKVIDFDSLSFSNCDEKLSFCNSLDSAENGHFKLNNNDDPSGNPEFTFADDITILRISERLKTEDVVDPLDSGKVFSNCSDQINSTNSLDPDTSKNDTEYPEKVKKSVFNQDDDPGEGNIVVNDSTDIEVEDIFTASVPSSVSDRNNSGGNSTQNGVVEDSSIKNIFPQTSFEPQGFNNDSKLENQSCFDTGCEKSQETNRKFETDSTEEEFGEFSDFSSGLENLEQNPVSTLETCDTPQIGELNEKLSDFFVRNTTSLAESSPSQKPVQESRPQEPHIDSDDDFADFTSHQAFPEPSHKITTSQDDKQDDFEDFGDFTSTVCDNEPSTVFQTEEDEFQSFADFSQSSNSIISLLDEREAFAKAEQAVKEMFPAIGDVVEDFSYFELVENDFIFKQLQDVTDTPALKYQWSKSSGQKALLKSLNIDARNILYGPSWNPSMPRFAANLGLQPLEPIRTEQPTSSILKPSPSIPQPQNVDIPSAQFDWMGSGLVNPLDSLPKDATTTNLCDPTKTLEIPAKTSEILFDHPNPTSETVSDNKPEDADDFDEFTSYQSSEIQQTQDWTNSLPLRETYISNTTPESIEAWLQPTIVTPELPRKASVVDEENSPEFADFQTSSSEVVEVESKSLAADTSKLKFDFVSGFNAGVKTEDVSNLVSGVGSSSAEAGFIDLSSLGSQNDQEVITATGSSRAENLPQQEEEDEFTDFQSSKPQIASAVFAPIMEPLKPVPVYPQTTPAQINWPDPGITEDEIKKFEEVFSRPMPAQTEEPKKPPVAPKQPSLDDEEWTDFVSVKKPSPVHKLKANERERTSSPDLPLSVFNLGSIQPAKQPVPVITPHGLVQTKLPVTASPKNQPRNALNSKAAFAQAQQLAHAQQAAHAPSIISDQFVNQAYNFASFASKNQNSVPSKTSNSTNRNWSFASQATQDDDEWGDFVSSPLPPQQQNGHAPQASGWSTGTNIITNPRHLVSTRVSGKGVVSGLVLPELEFIAPKGRTGTSRKK
nr:uncharacterized protein LOC111509715 [Leptinotarsa decemlineata]